MRMRRPAQYLAETRLSDEVYRRRRGQRRGRARYDRSVEGDGEDENGTMGQARLTTSISVGGGK